MPRRADRSLLPALLAGVLGLLLIVQCLLPVGGEISADVLAPLRVSRFSVAAMPPSADPSPVLERPLFAPRLVMSTAAQGSAPILGGASVAGTVSIRGRALAVVRRVDGSVYNLPLGGAVGGWRLVSLNSATARFQKGSEQLELAYGAISVSPPKEAESGEDDAE
jgi:hypothetical protein